MRESRRVFNGSAINAAAALDVSAAILAVLGFGFGTIPALGPALDPGAPASLPLAGQGAHCAIDPGHGGSLRH
jgi:hypothetical protein